MDQHLELLEDWLSMADCLKSSVRCRQCRTRLEWIPFDSEDGTSADEILCKCPHCSHALPIFKCSSYSACSIIYDLMSTTNLQVLASAINLILIGGNMLNSLSPPVVPDDPLEIVEAIYRESPSALKFGGPKAVIVADIHEEECVADFPILYIADTVSIPTRYYLHALKYRSAAAAAPSANNNNTDEGATKSRDLSEQLLLELIEIGNDVMQAGSMLVLGPRLQNLVSPDAYNRTALHNLSMIIPFDELKTLDGSSNFDVTDNFDEVCKEAVYMCNIVYTLVCSDVRVHRTADDLYSDLQRHLAAAIWLKTFARTPFEAMLYHILDEGAGEVEVTDS